MMHIYENIFMRRSHYRAFYCCTIYE